MKILLLIIFCLMQLFSSAQSNYIFSVPAAYDLHIELGNYSYKKPETWQIKFENIPAGNHKIKFIVTKPGTSYKITHSTTVEVKSGYEIIYFVIPYTNSLEFGLAAYYDLKKFNGNNAGTEAVGSDGRYITYHGKPVFSKADIADLKTRANAKRFDDDIAAFLKETMSKAMFYTEDVISMLSILKFDDTRVRLAKNLYDNTIDKHKYYQLSGSFKFSSSFDEVMAYVSKR